MSNTEQSPEGQSTAGDTSPTSLEERYSVVVGRFVQGVELVAATVFAALFAIGVGDLMLQILEAVQSGEITDPLVVIGFIDTGLLLLIIVEVYQTVLAYVEEDETRRIVRLVIYTGVIAMVRKAIIFRTGEYASTTDALFAAGSYAIIIFALVSLLFAEQNVGGNAGLLSEE
ncbi:phosphate-starvation-inducible PsiE family protein [Halovenus salina]|uniref:Phosphate-starvation-inducible PsiE family protein n=1 Tax=Halovenus salina TaxID=1510225 RepID=A0ABD5VZN5_9EURY|nr:phosphate-starvation-inducible PsiE family protein [Halovenus salina]